MPNEIRTWAIVPLLVLATGTIAGCIPALRASRVDPNVQLREL
jgi:ABC-type antimicrobial peptide transport system permease subunit